MTHNDMGEGPWAYVHGPYVHGPYDEADQDPQRLVRCQDKLRDMALRMLGIAAPDERER
jgi:hypothetical protein